MLQMIAAINEFERANLLERQKEGIAAAKKKGVYEGRKRIEIPDFDRYYQLWDNHEMSKTAIAKELKVSRTVIDRLINERRSKNG